MKNNKYAFFNLLKFIGSICIACFLHYIDHLIIQINEVNPFSEGSFLWFISIHSYVFVEMFFLISGILFAFVYIKRIENGEKLSDFLKGRYIRIYPLVIISSIFMYILNKLYFSQFGVFFSCGRLSLSKLFLDLFSLQTLFDGTTPINGPLWYITSLIVCYVLGYYLAKKSKKNSIVYVIPIIIGLYVMHNEINTFILNLPIARGLIAFFTGVVLYKFIFENIDRISKKLVLLSKLLCLIIVCLFVLCLFGSSFDLYFDSYNNTIIAFIYFFFIPLFYLLYDVKIIEKICSSKIVTFLGNISYSIYVWNFPILIVVSYLIKANILTIDIASFWFFVLLITVHIVVGILSYYLIEKKVKKHFDNKVKKLKKF